MWHATHTGVGMSENRKASEGGFGNMPIKEGAAMLSAHLSFDICL